MAPRLTGRSPNRNEGKVLAARFVGLLLIALASSQLSLSGCSSQAREQRIREASAHYKLGISYLNEKMNQEAFVEFQRAVELDPDDREIHYALGHIYFVQMRYDEAEREFNAAVEIDPDYSAAYNYLGKVYEQKGKLDRAIRQYRSALKNSVYATPDIAHYNLGQALAKKGSRKEAVEELRQATIINPDHVPAYYALAQIHMEDGEYDEGIRIYKEILRRMPDSADVRYELAWAYLKSGDRDQAAMEFKKITEQDPDSGLSRRSRRHLDFLQSKSGRLKSGMRAEQVLRVLGNADRVVRSSRETAGGEEWILSAYDLVLRFKDGRLIGYQQTAGKSD